MKRQIAVLLTLALASFANARTWTNDQGQTLEAEFVRLRGTTVSLRGEDGKLVQAPVARLGEEDQKWVEAYRDLARPREWGSAPQVAGAQPPVRGRFEAITDDGVSIAAAGGPVVAPFGKLTSADFENLQALYQHLGRELPATLLSARRKAQAAGPPKDAPEREWLSTSGKKIVARYGGTEGGKAVLWVGAKRFAVAPSKLSPADQRWIAQENLTRSLTGAQQAAAELTQAAMAKAMQAALGGAQPPGGQPPEALPPEAPQPPADYSGRPGDEYPSGPPDSELPGAYPGGIRPPFQDQSEPVR